ncbi:MAG: AIR synthase-related protein, partial [Bacteroidota bacterium]
KGDLVYLIGKSHNDINSSQYLVSYHGVEQSPAPYFNLEEEAELHKVVRHMCHHGFVNSAHDCADGGLFITLLEKALAGNLGFDITTPAEIRKDAFLFGEAQGRVVVTVSQDQEEAFTDMISLTDNKFSLLGHITKGELRVDDQSFGFIEEWRSLYEGGLEKNLAERS